MHSKRGKKEDATGPRHGLVPIAQIRPNPAQPRKHYDELSLRILARSIEVRGVIEPLIVRPRGAHFELVCGERRFRAAQAAGLTEVPVRAVEVSDDEAFVMALHENIHRDALTVLDEAWAYKRLLESGLAKSQRHLSEMLRVSQTRISQRIALLTMPPEVIRELGPVTGAARLTERHARAIRKAGPPSAQVGLAQLVVSRRLSVAQTEALVRAQLEGSPEAWEDGDAVRYRATAGGLEVLVRAPTPEAQAAALERLARRLRAGQAA